MAVAKGEITIPAAGADDEEVVVKGGLGQDGMD